AHTVNRTYDNFPDLPAHTVNRTYDKSDRTDKGNRAPGLTLCGIDGLARESTSAVQPFRRR
ncbi:MAG TPA: hypothetical protein PLQ14_04400, partial [Actinomycetota bacterium]|nr:hypothetical protein [Actinomycetota bacterium]HPQ83677.1 hypothetical protein [Actinomycetota bacterium]HRV65117.1 hypothetical protein [Candidatus Nanopelagicales bacterium]